MTTQEFEIFALRCRASMLTTARSLLHSDDEAEDVVCGRGYAGYKVGDAKTAQAYCVEAE